MSDSSTQLTQLQFDFPQTKTCECGCGTPIYRAKYPSQQARYINGHAPKRPLVERFWARVDQSGGKDACWLWTGSMFPKGYGRIGANGKTFRAHRFSWELHNGAIPEGMSVLHKCDNPPCVRPDHLFLGDNADNVADMVSKKRNHIPNGEMSSFSILAEHQVKEIRQKHKDGERVVALAEEYGITTGAIYSIIRRRTWRHVE